MNAKTPLNVGIIGAGFMGMVHVRACQQLPGLRVAALCNPSGRNLDGDFSSVAGNIGDPNPPKLDMSVVKATRDPAELLADPSIDVIDICTPTVTHRDLALRALAAGRHVLCEKPLARTSAEAREIAAAAVGAKGFLMPAMCLRFWPEWAWLKRAVEAGTHGRVLGARFRRVAHPPGWGQGHFGDGAKSGGALLDLHIHDTDFTQYCFGAPSSVFSTGYAKHTGAIDHVVTQYAVAGGAIVHAEGSWAMTAGFGFNMSYTVNFERATADYDIARGPENALKLYAEGREAETIRCEGGDGYVGELRHFEESIRAGRRPTVVTPEDGVMSLLICEAEERSIRSGRPEPV